MSNQGSLLITLVIVNDISELVDLKPGESPLSVSIFHWDKFPQDLEELGVVTAEEAKRGEYTIPSFGYTDAGGPPRIFHAGDLKVHDTKTIVMAIFA